MTTNYFDTFITASADSKADAGIVPAKQGGIAWLQYGLLSEHPYGWTSDVLLFEVYVRRKGIARDDYPAARSEFFAKPQACLRASPLVKQFGWGLHHDGEGRVAAYGIETEDYRRLSESPDIKRVAGMKSRRA